MVIRYFTSIVNIVILTSSELEDTWTNILTTGGDIVMIQKMELLKIVSHLVLWFRLQMSQNKKSAKTNDFTLKLLIKRK